MKNLRLRDAALEKLRNRFQKLLFRSHNLITRALNHRIHYGAFTLPRSAEISSDTDNFLF
jgi:hypothetical protein